MPNLAMLKDKLYHKYNMTKFKVALVQFQIRRFDFEGNMEKAEVYIKQASDLGVDIIVFPEIFLTGPIGNRDDYADTEGKFREHFRKLAAEYKIDIVPGSILEKGINGRCNITYYIDNRGKILAKYRKANLWLPERKYITPGNGISVFNTRYGKMGLVICWDLIFPEIFRKMVKQGVKCVICPSYWLREDGGYLLKYNKNSEADLVDAVCQSRAFENGIALMYCNAAGKQDVYKGNKIIKTKVLLGHSQVTLPGIGTVKKLDNNREGMLVQEIDTRVLEDAEKTYKIRKDLKNKLFFS